MFLRISKFAKDNVLILIIVTAGILVSTLSLAVDKDVVSFLASIFLLSQLLLLNLLRGTKFKNVPMIFIGTYGLFQVYQGNNWGYIYLLASTLLFAVDYVQITIRVNIDSSNDTDE